MKKQMKKNMRKFLALLAVMAMVLCNFTAFAEEPVAEQDHPEVAAPEVATPEQPDAVEAPEMVETPEVVESVKVVKTPETAKQEQLEEVKTPEAEKPEQPKMVEVLKKEKTPEVAASTKTVDITPPVIEEVTYSDVKKTYKPGDAIDISVRAYDADSKVAKVTVQLTYRKGDEWGTEENVSVELAQDSKDSNLWKGSHKVLESGHPEVQISRVTVVDANGYNANRSTDLPLSLIHI